MISTVESEIKFLVCKDDAKRFIDAHQTVSSGIKTMAYYDDADGYLEAQRATYRRYVSKNILVDEIKTVDSWTSANRICLEQRAPALIQDQNFTCEVLTERDVDLSVRLIVMKLINSSDFSLRLQDKLTVNRYVISVSNFAQTFDVDICVSDSGLTFCEIEFESCDRDELHSASEYILRMCKSAQQSDLTKRERTRNKR